MEVTAAIARERHGPFRLETLELDEPRHDEILVKIVAAGLCHTDLLVRDVAELGVTLPAVLGHEGSGIVHSVGRSITKVKPGDRVVLSFLSCGQCERCRQHMPAYCMSMAMLNFGCRRADGSTTLRNGAEEVAGNFFGQSSFATYALSHESNTVLVPDYAPLEIVGPLGCGIQTGAGAIINALACEAGSSLLVVGGGSVGLSAVLGAVVQGCSTIIVAEPYASRRDLALELGATHAIDPKTNDISGSVRAILPDGVNYAFDSSGRDDALESAVDAMAVLGTLGLVAGSGSPSQHLPGAIPSFIGRGLNVKGIVEGSSNPDVFIPYLLDLHKQGRFPFERLITTFPFDQINAALAAQHEGAAVKVVVLMP